MAAEDLRSKKNKRQYILDAIDEIKNRKVVGYSSSASHDLCAGHAWASIARENGVSLSVISEGMGHTSEKTTRIYLASLSQVVMDEANHKVLSSI